jgi:predicted small secreted protein
MFKEIMLLVTVMVVGSPSLLTGCNTIHGAGKDTAKAGDKVQQEAREHTN